MKPRRHEDAKEILVTEARAAVDVVGREAANGREHNNANYKKPLIPSFLYSRSCVLAARLRRNVDGCHGAD